MYLFQDVSRWKDLGSKFVLQIYRDYVFTSHSADSEYSLTHNAEEYNASTAAIKSFLCEMYPVVLVVMNHTVLFDKNEDGMIENEGYPDQT